MGEINHWGNTLGRISVPTIFFGGGTPSLMPVETLGRIMDAIEQNFDIDAGAEITMEANPGTLDAQKITEFYKCGINRMSIGVQSLNDDELQFLGRRHTADMARATIDRARTSGMRVSADFIYGLPGQGPDDVIQMCRGINELGLGHCSMYELTIEPGTPFGKMGLYMPSNSAMADMYAAIGDTLTLPRYEVSNYATPSQHCRHNENIWDGAPYIGIGRAAAGRIFMAGHWFEQMGAGELFHELAPHERAIERIITGMRTMRGVAVDDSVRSAINMAWVDAHPDLVIRRDGRICATNAGLMILDNVLTDMVV